MMMITKSNNVFRRRIAMLKAFRNFTAKIATRYDQVEELLEAGDYVKAQQVLSAIAISHARTSVSLRNVLIREGLLPSEDK